MLNYWIAVKFYTDKDKAMEEDNVFSKIKQLTQNCLGIVPYYGMKKMLIELEINQYHFLLRINGSSPFERYILFFEEC